jgi:segregation and condensation protein B
MNDEPMDESMADDAMLGEPTVDEAGFVEPTAEERTAAPVSLREELAGAMSGRAVDADTDDRASQDASVTSGEAADPLASLEASMTSRGITARRTTDAEEAGIAEADGAGSGELAVERTPGWETDADWERDLRREQEVAARAAEAEAAAAEGTEGHDTATLARVIEGLLFLSPDPVPAEQLVEATGASADAIADAIAELDRQYAPGERGLIMKRVAGGITFGTDPICEPAARALLSTQRIPPLSAAQAETLAIVAYLQPVARPEISRIRGVAADSATSTLLERGLIEEAGRSEFGAVLYRTTSLFLRLFGIDSLSQLPDTSTWDPAPEEEDELRERLMRAGGARSGGPGGGPAVELPQPRELGDDPGHVDMPGDAFLRGTASDPDAEDGPGEDGLAVVDD